MEIFEGSYNEIETWISNGTIDLGISATSPKGLEFIPLWKDDLIVITNKNNSLGSKGTISIKEMQSQPFIMPKSGCDLLIKDIFRENGAQPNVKFEIEDNNALLAMVSKGIGASIVPEMTLNFNSFELEKLKLTPEYFRTIGILLRSYNTASPAALAFIKIVKDISHT